MAKSQDNKKIYWMIGVAVIVLFLLKGTGGGRELIAQSPTFADDFIESDYIVKFGLESTMPNDMETLSDDGNFMIDKAYGVAIFDSPIVLNNHLKNGLVDFMEKTNDGQGIDDTLLPYLSYPIFSDGLIAKVEENSYDITDLKFVLDELNDAKDIICGGISDFADDYPSEIEGEFIIDLCKEYKGKDAVKMDGLNFVLDLKDFEVPSNEYDCSGVEWVCISNEYDDLQSWEQAMGIYTIIGQCINQGGVVNCGKQDPERLTIAVMEMNESSCSNTISAEIAAVNNNSGIIETLGTNEYGVIEYWNKEDDVFMLCSDDDNFAIAINHNNPEIKDWYFDKYYSCSCHITITYSTLRLSDAKLEINTKAGDIIVGVGTKGIAEAKTIEGRYEFAQYSYQISHENAKSLYAIFGQAGYAVISNNAEVIDASGGLISETSNFKDLWYGVKNNLVDPISVAKDYWNYILIGAGILLVIILISKK